MRRLRRGRGKRQKQILIVSTLVLFSILTIGYAAFQTNISLTAKGNAKPSATYTVDDLKSLVTAVGDGLYTDPDEQGRYVYKGADPANYLTLNGETWRIMSIEPDNTIKIIREDSIGNIPFDPGNETVISGITTSGSDTGTRYSTTRTDYCYYEDTNYGCNVWGNKDTMRNSEGVLLKNTTGGAKIPKDEGTGRFLLTYDLPDDEAYLNVYLNGGTYAGVTVTGWYSTWSSNLDSKVESYIEDEHIYNVGLVAFTENQLMATDISQEKKLTWQGRVGLMTASEYARASINSECTGVYAYNSNSACYNNGMSHNYLTKEYFQWAISPHIFYHPAFSYHTWHAELGFMATYYSSFADAVRPVFYLSPNTILKGAGTSGSEFQIANTEPNPDSGGSSQGGSSSGSGGGSSSSSMTVYAINTNMIFKNTSTLQDIGTTYNSCAATGKSTCLRYTIENDTVTGAEACFIKGGTEYCLTGWHDESSLETTPVYNANVLTLQTTFTESGACNDDGSYYICNAAGLNAYSASDGLAGASVDSWDCYVKTDGFAGCHEFG